MRIETPADGYVEIERDDSNVFEQSRSAIVLTLGSNWSGKDTLDFGGATQVGIRFHHTETQLSFPMSAARKLHEELGRLIAECPK